LINAMIGEVFSTLPMMILQHNREKKDIAFVY